MAAKKPLNVGLVGCGFMGRTHSNAWGKVNQFFDLEHQPVLKAVCARNAEEVQGFAANWGYASTETDWRTLVARDDIDLIDIASPNDTHAEIAIAAARAGKMVATEKPLARGGAESEAMVAAVDAAGVPNMVWYNYRRVPAVTLARQLIDEGRLGQIFHYRAKFLQDWTISKDLPQGGAALWRLDVNVAGSGVTGDLLAHCIDTAMWLNGPIDRVSAMTETFVKERKHALTDKVQKVGIDDLYAWNRVSSSIHPFAHRKGRLDVPAVVIEEPRPGLELLSIFSRSHRCFIKQHRLGPAGILHRPFVAREWGNDFESGPTTGHKLRVEDAQQIHPLV